MVHGFPHISLVVAAGYRMIAQGKYSTYGDEKLRKAKDCFTFESESTAMGNEEHATTLVMSKLWGILQGSDRDDKGVSRLAKFCN